MKTARKKTDLAQSCIMTACHMVDAGRLLRVRRMRKPVVRRRLRKRRERQKRLFLRTRAGDARGVAGSLGAANHEELLVLGAEAHVRPVHVVRTLGGLVEKLLELGDAVVLALAVGLL